MTNRYASAMKGKVRWFDNKKGYGFITDEAGKDLFVHFTNIVCEGFRGLNAGRRVEYDVEDGAYGLQAVNVRAIK